MPHTATSSSSSSETSYEDSIMSTSTTPVPSHPFANSKGLLVVIPQDHVDVEEESAFYEEFEQQNFGFSVPRGRSPTLETRSLISGEICLGDSRGESMGFTKDVRICGWTSVGDKMGGAYVVYDVAVITREGTTFHILKRYSDFEQLYVALRKSLPGELIHNISSLPPKSPLARYRPAFLESRRRRLQHWLSAVLLHPEVGGSQVVRQWVMSK